MSTLAAPATLIESVGNLRLPRRADRRLTELMDRHNDGLLQPHEIEELESLVEISETMSLVRAEALRVLGRSSV